MTTRRPPARPPAGCTGYCLVWTLLAVLVYAAAAVAVLRGLPWQSSVTFFLTSGAFAGACAMSWDAVRDRTPRLGSAAWVGVRVGGLVVAGLGLAAAFGSAGVLALLGLHVAAPTFPARVRRVARSWRERPTHDLPVAPYGHDDALGRSLGQDQVGLGWDAAEEAAAAAQQAPEHEPRTEVLDATPLQVPTAMSDLDLCLAWESSTEALRGPLSAQARLSVVESRQACLDELERRRPDAVHAWLAQGLDSISPARYLIG